MAYVITQPCVDVKDMACVEECPTDCIYEGVRCLYINPEECVECGACMSACPNEAIFHEDDVPEDQAEFIKVAAEFFAEIGSPGGASKHGPFDADHPFVAALP
ncbi:MAG: ferredoxin family protein [Propionibacteriaceae bacterium]|nr:ferredoxin family protein [Propionibacteriaceae bacterium]